MLIYERSETEEIKVNCTELLERFMIENGIDKCHMKKVEARISEFNDANEDKADVEYNLSIITNIIVDSFKLNSENLKIITDYCVKQGYQIGRRHKKIMLRFLNYRKSSDLELFFKELSVENNNIDINDITKKIKSIPEIESGTAIESFLDLWNTALQENDEKKMSDYLFGIYSKLHAIYNSDSMSKADLFKYNEPFINGDLSKESIAELKLFCEDDNQEESFYNKYVGLLRKELQQQSLSRILEPIMNQKQFDPMMKKENKIFDRKGDTHYILTEEYDAVYLRLNQQVFDSFDFEKEFYNYVLDTIQQAYRILINNKVFSVEIDVMLQYI